MRSPDDQHRPESLPEQVARITSHLGGLATRHRARWTPIACVLVWIALVVAVRVVRGWPAAPPYASAKSAGEFFLHGTTHSGMILVGLGTALSAAPFARRWTIGAAVTGLFIATDAIAGPYSYDVYGSVLTGLIADVSSYCGRWSTWIAVGLGVRVLTRSVFGRDGSAPSGSSDLRVGDLLLLTAVVAISFGFNRWWIGRYAAISPIDTIEPSGWLAWAHLPLTLLLTPLSLGLVLAASFPITRIRPSRLAIAAALSVAISTAFDLLNDLMLRTMFSNAAPAMVFPPIWNSILSKVAANLGVVIGIVSVALWLRWAGYRRIALSTGRIAPNT